MDTSFALISILLLSVATVAARHARLTTLQIGLFLLISATTAVFIATYFAIDSLTGEGINEAAIYHLRYGLEGAGFSEYRWLILGSSAAALLCVLLVARYIRHRPSRQHHLLGRTRTLPFLLALSAILFTPLSTALYRIETAGSTASSKPSPEAIAAFQQHYHIPKLQRTEASRRNLVFIYAEGLEHTYFDEALFPDLIVGLRHLERSAISFTNIRQLSNTDWTIAGITASQCGIPLYSPSHGNSMSGMDRFLSGATCLGDALRPEGYRLEFMGGADLAFAGKGKFFQTHGFHMVLGRQELLPRLQDPSYRTGWGLYDDSLLELVYRRFIELSRTGKPFGLFTLTLDTHHPKGHPSRSCRGIKYADGSNPILNAVSCSDHLLTKFIKRILSSEYAANTVVVLASDHLAQRNTAFEILEAHQDTRRNTLMIWSPDHERRTITTTGSTLDTGATVLPFIGYRSNIGLGRNLLSPRTTSNEIRQIHTQLPKWKPLIEAMWEFPKVEENLTIDIANQRLLIDQRSFRIPAMVEIGQNLQTTLKFDFDRAAHHKSLLDHLNTAMRRGSNYILVNKCENLKAIDPFLNENGWCLLHGNGKHIIKISQINGLTSFDKARLISLIEEHQTDKP